MYFALMVGRKCWQREFGAADRHASSWWKHHDRSQKVFRVPVSVVMERLKFCSPSITVAY